MAEFAKGTYLLFSGGIGAEAWKAKLTIRDHRVAEREFACGNERPILKRFLRPTVLSAPVSLITNTVVSIRLSDPKQLPQQVQP
jgi:hypothetical protein